MTVPDRAVHVFPLTPEGQYAVFVLTTRKSTDGLTSVQLQRFAGVTLLDFQLVLSVPLISGRCADVLSATAPDDIQLVRAVLPDVTTPLWLLNLLRGSGPSNAPSLVDPSNVWSIHGPIPPGAAIFRDASGRTFCSDAVAEKLRAASISGLQLMPVPS
jgi:hypothetical protein